jgi:saccharopine dehydrogenase-like NADP-dependent oxidoreductase
MSYLDVLRDHKPVGEKVAVIGAGGIGFDVAEYLVEKRERRMLKAIAITGSRSGASTSNSVSAAA